MGFPGSRAWSFHTCQGPQTARSPPGACDDAPSVWPSAMLNDVGTPVAIISQLNTRPACAPVSASMAAVRLATHDSGPGWIGLSRRTQQPASLGNENSFGGLFQNYLDAYREARFPFRVSAWKR